MAVYSKKTKAAIGNHVILMLLALIIILPVLVLLFNSIKPDEEFGVNPLGFPQTVRLMNYYDAFVAGNYAKIMVNSILLVAGTLAVCLTFSSLAAFSLAVLNPNGKSTIMIGIYLLVGLSIPAQLFILPLFIIWKNLHLNNTYVGLIIIYSALNAPFAVFLIRSYMIQLPKELFEAAIVEGASTIQLFTRVALPLSWPVFLTTGLVVSLAVWNEFLFAVTFIHNEEFKPISSILYSFQNRRDENYALISAASVMMAAPLAVLFILFQRNFIAGLTSGGTKG